MGALFGWRKGGFWPPRMGVWVGKAWDSYRIREMGAVLRALAGGRKVKNKLQSDKMFYRRHYIDKWIKEGWIEEEKVGGLSLTKAGEMVTEVFGG